MCGWHIADSCTKSANYKGTGMGGKEWSYIAEGRNLPNVLAATQTYRRTAGITVAYALTMIIGIIQCIIY